MRKRVIALFMVIMMMGAMLVGCGSNNNAGTNEPAQGSTGSTDAPSTPDKIAKIAMVTDSGTIDDKSFNEGTWKGIVQFEREVGGIQTMYLQPSGEDTSDYVNAITDLVDNGYEMIITPGFKFETAIYEVQDRFPHVKFVLIDGTPHDGDWANGPNFHVADNTLAVFYAEQEAGFLAGVAAALATETGKLGFLGGMEIPPVQKFGWGYVAGIQYANEHFGTNAEISDSHYVYQGSFDDIPAGGIIASGMYDAGVDIIFHAAGGTGVGAIGEAIERQQAGEKVFVIGVDIDQYEDGFVGSSDQSVILTSALKGITLTAFEQIEAFVNGNFVGGKEVRLTAADGAVGLPEENPNLSPEIMEKVAEAEQAIINGDFIVPDSLEALDAYLGR